MTITLTSGRGRNGRGAADCDKLALKYRGSRLAVGVRRERYGWLAELMDSYYAILLKEAATLGLCSSMASCSAHPCGILQSVCRAHVHGSVYVLERTINTQMWERKRPN